MEISVKKLLNANPYELAKLAFCLNKESVQEAFARVGILVEDKSDLKALALLNQRGGDKKGDFKNLKGEPIYFDFEEILGNVEMSEGDQKRCHDLDLNWSE